MATVQKKAANARLAQTPEVYVLALPLRSSEPLPSTTHPSSPSSHQHQPTALRDDDIDTHSLSGIPTAHSLSGLPTTTTPIRKGHTTT